MAPKKTIDRDYMEEKFRSIHDQLIRIDTTYKDHVAADRIDFDKISTMILHLDRAKAEVHAAMDKRIDRLEVFQAARVRHFGYIWTMMAGILAVLLGMIKVVLEK